MPSLPHSALHPARFRRSSLCGGSGCVEVAALPDGGFAVRDAKDRGLDAPVLRFTDAEWDAFLGGVRAGEFSRDALSAEA